MDLTLTLTLEEVNGILVALGNMPFAQVEALVTKIRAQAQPQVDAAQAAAAAPVAPATPADQAAAAQ